MPVIITEEGPFARAMRVGEGLSIALQGKRAVFESAGEVNTTIMPMLGVRMEFDQPVAFENDMGTGHCLRPRLKVCTYIHVWLSSVSGESKPALMFEDGTMVLLEQILPGQRVRVLAA